MNQNLNSYSKYYRWSLKTAEAKLVYDTILSGFDARQRKIAIDKRVLDKSKYPLSDLINFVGLDNPRLFFVDFQTISGLLFPNHTEIAFDFLYPDEKIELTLKKMNDRIDQIVRKVLESNLVPYYKEIMLHDYLINNVRYEHENSSYHKAHSAVGAILHGRAVCEGYAKAFKLLCDACKIPSIVVIGTAKPRDVEEGHAWNIVKLEEKCYHVDVTWDNGAMFNGKPSYSCFNLTDADISSDHDWNKQILPKCTSLEDNYYVRSGAYFTSKKALKQYLNTGLNKGMRNFSIKINHHFEDRAKMDKIIAEVINAFTLAKLVRCTYTWQFDQKRSTMNLLVEVMK